MKKYLLTLIFLLISSAIFANEKGDMFLAPKAGIGFSIPPEIYLNANSDWATVLNIGIAFDYFFIDKFAFTTELLYEYQPMHYNYTFFNATHIFNFNYITIPMGVRYYWKYVLAGTGLYYGIKLKNKEALREEGTTNTIGSLDDKNDIGIFFDFGLNLKLFETNNLSIYARYKYGFLELIEEYPLRTNTLTFNIAYGFKF